MACGWGEAKCVDAAGETGQLCDYESKKEGSAMMDQVAHQFLHCFKPCEGDAAMQNMCIVTINHLDQQYGSLTNLFQKTCVSGDQGEPDPELEPHILVLLTQELNHAARAFDGANDFPVIVHEEALPGYTRSAVCEGQLSPNTAIFVKHGFEGQLFPQKVGCTGDELISKPCSW